MFALRVWDWDKHHKVLPAINCGNCTRTWQTVGWEDRNGRPGNGSHGHGGSSALSQKLGGSWYSLIGAAECTGDRRPGLANACSWRVSRLVSIKNATCVLGRVAAVAHANQSACFARCPDRTVYPEAPSVSIAAAPHGQIQCTTR